MIFIVHIKGEGPAVANDPRREVALALTKVAETVCLGFDAGAIRDSDGTLIGSWTIAEAG